MWLRWAQLSSFCFSLVLAGRAHSWTRGTGGTAQPRHACTADARLTGTSAYLDRLPLVALRNLKKTLLHIGQVNQCQCSTLTAGWLLTACK